MIRLTYLHWNDQTPGALLLNPAFIIAVTPMERDGKKFSQVCVQGYSFSVAETVDEVSAAILSAPR